jgi:hypothetical protein
VLTSEQKDLITNKFDLSRIEGIVLFDSKKACLSGTFNSHELRRLAGAIEDASKIKQEMANG